MGATLSATIVFAVPISWCFRKANDRNHTLTSLRKVHLEVLKTCNMRLLFRDKTFAPNKGPLCVLCSVLISLLILWSSMNSLPFCVCITGSREPVIQKMSPHRPNAFPSSQYPQSVRALLFLSVAFLRIATTPDTKSTVSIMDSGTDISLTRQGLYTPQDCPRALLNQNVSAVTKPLKLKFLFFISTANNGLLINIAATIGCYTIKRYVIWRSTKDVTYRLYIASVKRNDTSSSAKLLKFQTVPSFSTSISCLLLPSHLTFDISYSGKTPIFSVLKSYENYPGHCESLRFSYHAYVQTSELIELLTLYVRNS